MREATIELLEAVFSMRPVSRCYKQTLSGVSAVQGSEELIGELVRDLQFSRRELLLLEACS
jgi:hypothetical protein